MLDNDKFVVCFCLLKKFFLDFSLRWERDSNFRISLKSRWVVHQKALDETLAPEPSHYALKEITYYKRK